MDDDTIQHEVFASFAEHLVPEAFATPTRAYRVTHETSGPVPADGVQARARFDRWIDDRIEDALAASWPHDRPLVVAFTSDGHLLRRYDEDGNEVAEILRQPSTSNWTATWYAEARGGGVADTFAGELHLDAKEITSAGPLHVRFTAETRALE